MAKGKVLPCIFIWERGKTEGHSPVYSEGKEHPNLKGRRKRQNFLILQMKI